MRVITGTARGRRMKEPADRQIRPTTDKVKESIFNIIQFDIEGRRILDLFAGTGQLGIEAKSRGAGETVFVDESPAAVRLVQDNLKMTGLTEGTKVFRGDALSLLKTLGKFDVIFMDPPYETELIAHALEIIIAFDILRENGIIVCESKLEKVLPEVSAPYFMRKEYKYGKIKISVYSREADSV